MGGGGGGGGHCFTRLTNIEFMHTHTGTGPAGDSSL